MRTRGGRAVPHHLLFNFSLYPRVRVQPCVRMFRQRGNISECPRGATRTFIHPRRSFG